MTRIDRLNVASDLKRIAYWLAVGDKTKARLMSRMLKKDYLKLPSIKSFEKILNNKNMRLALAEELLLTSIRLEHQ